jgi:death-on-curing protein
VGEPVWVGLGTMLAVHDEQLAEHGGQPGVRDSGLLEAALARPRQRYAYGSATLPELAASLAYGLSRDHPFIDGNKRASLVAAELFLHLNGAQLVAADEEIVVTILRLAADELSEAELAAWIAAHTR